MFAKRAVGLILSAVFSALLLLSLSLPAVAEEFEEGCSCCFPINDDSGIRRIDDISENIADDCEFDTEFYGGDSALYDAGEIPSLSFLQQRYLHGKYWNYGNLDGYSDTPCQKHRGSVSITCNDYYGSTQCLGFARKLGYDAYGTDPKYDWQTADTSEYIPYLKPGDIIRYRSNSHSVFVTDVFESYIIVGECNWDNCCGISWGRIINKSDLDITTIFIAPYALPGGTIMNVPTPQPTDCGCSESYSGLYITYGVTDNLLIRSGHGTNYPAIGRIPANALFNVTKANGSWAHVTYNGVSGYASMYYMQRVECYEHYWILTEETAVSCTVDGYKWYKCSLCGEERCDYISALGHIYEDILFESIYPYYEFQPCKNCTERLYTGDNGIDELNAIYDHICGYGFLSDYKYEKYDRYVRDGVIDIRDYNSFFVRIFNE